MIPFSLVGIACGIWTLTLDFISELLVREHLSGTSQKLLSRGFLGAFLGGSFAFLFIENGIYLFSNVLFVTLLGITLFTDTRVMLISRFVTVYTIPFALILSSLDMLPITIFESMFGCMLGYALLAIVEKIGARWLNQEALGQGDIDLLTMIGAFTGPLGCWVTLSIGSLLGSFVGLFALLIGHNRATLRLPFGTFLALAGIIFTLFSKAIYTFFLIPLH